MRAAFRHIYRITDPDAKEKDKKRKIPAFIPPRKTAPGSAEKESRNGFTEKSRERKRRFRNNGIHGKLKRKRAAWKKNRPAAGKTRASGKHKSFAAYLPEETDRRGGERS